MGLGRWLARRGNVGGTARAVAKGWLKLKQQNPQMSSKDIADAYIQLRYTATGEAHLADKIFYPLGDAPFGVSPIKLAWAILKAENDDDLDTLFGHEETWKDIMKEEMLKLGLNPEETRL